MGTIDKIWACLRENNIAEYFLGHILGNEDGTRHLQVRKLSKVVYPNCPVFHHFNDYALAEDYELTICHPTDYLRKVSRDYYNHLCKNLYNMEFEPENWANHVEKLPGYFLMGITGTELIGKIISKVFVNDHPGGPPHLRCEGKITGYDNATNVYRIRFTGGKIRCYNWNNLVSLIDYRDRLVV